VTDVNRREERLAVDCLWLRRTIDSSRKNDPFVTLCTHIIRDGKDCVGPFLDSMDTDCQLWEPNERLAAKFTPATPGDD
jgi:hypothetical protein